MNLKNEDRILRLASKKLAKEATAAELKELADLLDKNPEENATIKRLADWWTAGNKKSENRSSLYLLEEIIKK